jgi:uncharacterized protein with PIN domain
MADQMIRFIVDAQLHKLARLLRMAGFDAMLDPSLDDDDLVEVTLDEERILLTKDKLLLKNQLLTTQCMNILSNDPLEQLKEVMLRFNLQASLQPLTRCLECNLVIVPIDKNKVKEKVPEPIFAQMKEFFTCENCRRIYWKGSHYDHMQEMIASLG